MLSVFGKTMSTQQYLNKKGKLEIDKIFDEAIKQAKDEEIQLMQQTEYENYVISLITKLADLESQVSIMKDIYLQKLKSINPNEEINDLKEKRELTNLKRQYTKVYNELNNVIRKEQVVKSH